MSKIGRTLIILSLMVSFSLLSVFVTLKVLAQAPPYTNPLYGAFFNGALPNNCNNGNLAYNVFTFQWLTCGPIGTWASFLTNSSSSSSIGNPIGFTNLNGGVGPIQEFSVDLFPSSGNISGVGYSTQLDYAFYSVAALSVIAGQRITLRLGDGVYQTNACLTQPMNATYGVNLIGNGWSSSRGGAKGPSQIIGRNGGCTGTLYSDPTGKIGGVGVGSFVKNIAFNANGALECFEIYGEIKAYFENLSCYNANGSDHWWAIGPGTGDSVLQSTIVNIYSEFGGHTASSWASVTASGTGALTLTLNSGGSYVSTQPHAAIYGTGSSMNPNNPCDVMGTIAVTLTGTAVSSITPSGFSGCHCDSPSACYVQVQDIPRASYGGVFGLATDNQIYNVETQGIGTIAGLRVEHGNNRFYGTSIQQSVVGVLDGAPETNQYFGIKFDSIFHFGFESVNGKGAIYGTSFIWNDNYPGAGGYLFDSTATNLSLYSSSCVSNQTAGGYNLFVSKSGGVLSGFDPTSLLASIPGLRLSNVDVCDGSGNSFDLTPIPILYSVAGTPVPTCNSGSKGLKITVSDAVTPTYNGTYTGGSMGVPANLLCNGSTWITQ